MVSQNAIIVFSFPFFLHNVKMILEMIPICLWQNVCNYLTRFNFCHSHFTSKSHDALTFLSLNVAFDSKEARLFEKKNAFSIKFVNCLDRLWSNWLCRLENHNMHRRVGFRCHEIICWFVTCWSQNPPSIKLLSKNSEQVTATVWADSSVLQEGAVWMLNAYVKEYNGMRQLNVSLPSNVLNFLTYHLIHLLRFQGE